MADCCMETMALEKDHDLIVGQYMGTKQLKGAYTFE